MIINLNANRLDLNLQLMSIPLPLTQRSITLANAAASNYASPAKSQQIRLNTLAVLVVNDFLSLLQVQTDVKQGDSWGKIAALMDTADLVLPGFGKLECRPIVGPVRWNETRWDDTSKFQPPHWHNQTAHVPAEVWTDRIGFVMIQIDEEHKLAELLGFTATVEMEEFPLSQLQPMTALVDRLEALQPATFSIPVLRSSFSALNNTVTSASSNAVTNTVQPIVTRISDWFHETLEAGWQNVESLALPPAFAFRLREPSEGEASFRICRGKVINLDLESALVRSVPRQVSLIVSIQPSFNSTDPNRVPETQVTLSFYPISPNVTLPLFHAAIRDDAGVVHYEGDAEADDEFLEFEFNCGADEQFDVLISGVDFQVIERFGN